MSSFRRVTKRDRTYTERLDEDGTVLSIEMNLLRHQPRLRQLESALREEYWDWVMWRDLLAEAQAAGLPAGVITKLTAQRDKARGEVIAAVQDYAAELN